MAKAQNRSSDKDDAPKKPAPAAKKATISKAKSASGGSAKKSRSTAPAAAPQAPLIDTNHAASAAAAMILNRAVTGSAQPATSGQREAKKESATFKNLKDSLNKPASSGLGGLLGGSGQQKKSNLPFGGGKQVGRNQTFGADVNRAGVPRRTGGG